MLTEFDKSWCSPELRINRDGIALLVSHEEKILVVREMTNKPSTGKTAGELSIVCETRDSKSEDIRDTLLRGIKQELGIKGDEIYRYFDRFSEISMGKCLFTPGTLAHIYKIKCIDPDGVASKINKYGDGEVKFVGWWSLDQLANPQNGNVVRPGVSNVIKFVTNLGVI